MRILHVNKFLYRRGGAEAYMLDLASLQRERGDEVELFGMQYPDNEPQRYEASFPSRVDFDPPPPSLDGKIRGAGRLLWSRSAAHGIAVVLDGFRPDLVHLHNIYHQLSPSILAPMRAAGVAVVMTLHDYKLACPTYRFLDHGRICEACVPHRFWSPILRRCNGGSLAASALNALEMSLHTAIGAYGPVHRFICPSRFLERKMREGRVYPDRLRVVPNFVDVRAIDAKVDPGGGVIAAGRLSDEKGFDVLLEAVRREPDLSVDVAGDGPARADLEAQIASSGVADRVRFHGRLPSDELAKLMRRSAVMALPSRWYENMPLSVLEAFASGIPVVGSDLGGIPDLIQPGIDGDLVPPNDPSSLGRALSKLVRDPARAFEMGRAGRAKVERAFSPAEHLRQLGVVYDEALSIADRRDR